MASTSKVGVRGVDTTMYLVKDLDRATRFYTDLFGFAPTLSFGGIGSEWTFPGGETFGIIKPAGVLWSPGVGVHFGVDDVKAAIAACERNGVKMQNNAAIHESPGCYLAFAEDSEGNYFILHELKPRD